jgi:ectoine hydroxylase-related dioxygenase (phytanoyl-CoA dioxygenase family)
VSRLSDISRALRDPRSLGSAARDPRRALRKLRAQSAGSALTDAQRASWNNSGFVVLPRFFSPEQLMHVNDELDIVWDDRARDDRELVIDVHIGTNDERRIRFGRASDESRLSPYKLNDLYLVSPITQAVVLDPQLLMVLAELLEGAPIAINSLTFERGSQQDLHFDTFYMPPLVENRMLATWIALETADPAAGPLRYYPGSHRIPAYRFSDGRLNASPAEMPAFYDYIGPQLEAHRLTETTFAAEAGDVFIWHAQLFHGGSAITDHARTRRSLVTHYFRAEDMDPGAVIDVGGGRYYLQRAHQRVE